MSPGRPPGTRPEPWSCSTRWDDDGPDAAGTAARAGFWVALEQPGPWGRSALTQSGLDPVLGAALEQACSDAGGRLLLIRSPGPHRDTAPAGRRVLVAGGLAGRPWLLEGEIDDPALLERLPLDRLPDDDPGPALERLPSLRVSTRPHLLVCTNGKRDVCCAVRGRPVAQDAGRTHPGQVWECSHTGGHRFAPTGVCLPSGQTWARLTPERAGQVLDAAARGEIPAGLNDPWFNRGRSALPEPAQAAEAWLRRERGVLGLDAIRARVAGRTADGHLVEAAVEGDRRPVVLLVREVPGPRLPASCGKDPAPATRYEVQTLPPG